MFTNNPNHPNIIQRAHHVRIEFCLASECARPHVILLDKDDTPIAEFVCPDPDEDGSGFTSRLHYFACRAVAYHYPASRLNTGKIE